MWAILMSITVIGGHCGTHFVSKPRLGWILDGNGNNFVQTNLFSVQGKIYDEANTPPGIESVRTSYLVAPARLVQVLRRLELIHG